MNTPANVIPDAQRQAHAMVPTEIPATTLFYWSVRRELWEYRSLYIAPLAVAAVFLVGFAISTVYLPSQMRMAAGLNLMQQHALSAQPYDNAALLLMGVGFIIALYYSVEALHGERRDRSILFWKSLPVSDATTVLAKASVPIIVVPVLVFLITAVTQIIILLLSGVVLAASGSSVATVWSNVSLPSMWWMLFAHLVGGHGLWYAPIYGWLILVSAWAKRAPILWATLPVLAIAFIEKTAFNTSYFITMLGDRLVGGPDRGTIVAAGSNNMESMLHLDPVQFLTSPGLWIGLALTAAFLAGAVRLRRSQGPI
ncbi:MAG: transporter, inner rane subunit [Acidobacteriales bacterium]|nr:transporter, inner rane subunit [Terriglobales bacterium]